MIPICLLLLQACELGFADDGAGQQSPTVDPFDISEGSDSVGDNVLSVEPDFRKVALYETNKYRRRHGAEPLVLDDQLNQDAQAYAEVLAQKNFMEHSCTKCNDYGENLYMMYGIIIALAKVTKKAIKSWYKEVRYYNFRRGAFSKKTGHFTALVWKGSKKMGFGVAVNQNTKSTFVVARYVPPGNMWGEFQRNVGPSE